MTSSWFARHGRVEEKTALELCEWETGPCRRIHDAKQKEVFFCLYLCWKCNPMLRCGPAMFWCWATCGTPLVWPSSYQMCSSSINKDDYKDQGVRNIVTLAESLKFNPHILGVSTHYRFRFVGLLQEILIYHIYLLLLNVFSWTPAKKFSLDVSQVIASIISNCTTLFL